MCNMKSETFLTFGYIIFSSTFFAKLHLTIFIKKMAYKVDVLVREEWKKYNFMSNFNAGIKPNKLRYTDGTLILISED